MNGTDPEDIDLDRLTDRAGGHALVTERAGSAYRFLCQCGAPLGTVTDLRRIVVVVLRWESHLVHGTAAVPTAEEDQDVAHDAVHVPVRGHHVPARGRGPSVAHRGTHAPEGEPVGRRVEDLRPL